MGEVKILSASAGSGKTYQLAYEYIKNVVDNPSLYRNVLAVTFTNKATEEMKQRIIAEINALANFSSGSSSGVSSPYMKSLASDLGLSPEVIKARAADVRTKILHDYSHFTIVTIDKFFQRIIRSFIKELGIELNFNLELRTDSILSAATDRLIDEITTDEKLRAWVVQFVEEKIDENKAWDIKTELAKLGQEVFKERYKTPGATALPKEELGRIVGEEIGKSKAAADKMKEIAVRALSLIEENGLSIDDFSNGKGGFAGYFIKIGNGVFEKYGKRVQDALASDEKWYAKASPRKADIINITPALRPLLEELCGTYDSTLRQRNTAHLLKENFRSFALLTDLTAKINDLCAEQNILPISETNSILNKLIEGNDAPFIFEKAGNNFSHYMIDEFQDTSVQQWTNFLPLLHNSVAQSEKSTVLLVGDVKQSIYRWRGGDWQILGKRVGNGFSDVSVKNLDTNYRSFRQIVDFNNHTTEHAVQNDNERLNEALKVAFEDGSISKTCRTELTDMLLNAYQGHIQKANSPENKGFIRITEYPVAAKEKGNGTEGGNADVETGTGRHGESMGLSVGAGAGAETCTPKSPVIATIEELQERGYSPGDIAILVRYKNDGIKIANELLDQKTINPGSPYRYDVVTQEALTISNSAAVGFIIAVMSLSENINDAIKRAVYNRYLGKNIDGVLSTEESAFIKSLRLVSLEEALEEVLLRYGLNAKEDEIAYIQALQEQMLSFGTSKISDIPLFLKWWNETGCKESIKLPENPQAITIITIHKAKGLQYKAVIIPCCDWSLEPKTNSVIWAESTHGSLNSLAKVPVKYKKEMGDSYFAEDYYREKVLSHIDNINTFYVAATRAEEELHILIPQKKNHSGSISGLILESIPDDSADNSTTIGDDGSIVHEFGTPVQSVKAGPETDQPSRKTDQHQRKTDYPSRKIGSRLKFRLGSERYFGKDVDAAEGSGTNNSGGTDATPDGIPPGSTIKNAGITLSPRNYGVIMHKIFENISDITQIDSEIEVMRANSLISETEMMNVRDIIKKSFENPMIKSWYDRTWDVVRNEHDIITPSTRGISNIRRPDRVITKGTDAVIIDYKFGRQKKDSYTRQIQEYKTLLERMGYKTVKGYIWYVELQEIEQT